MSVSIQLKKKFFSFNQTYLGADYMSRSGPVRRAGSFSRDPGTSEKYTKNQVCNCMEESQPG